MRRWCLVALAVLLGGVKAPALTPAYDPLAGSWEDYPQHAIPLMVAGQIEMSAELVQGDVKFTGRLKVEKVLKNVLSDAPFKTGDQIPLVHEGFYWGGYPDYLPTPGHTSRFDGIFLIYPRRDATWGYKTHLPKAEEPELAAKGFFKAVDFDGEERQRTIESWLTTPREEGYSTYLLEPRPRPDGWPSTLDEAARQVMAEFNKEELDAIFVGWSWSGDPALETAMEKRTGIYDGNRTLLRNLGRKRAGEAAMLIHERISEMLRQTNPSHPTPQARRLLSFLMPQEEELSLFEEKEEISLARYCDMMSELVRTKEPHPHFADPAFRVDLSLAQVRFRPASYILSSRLAKITDIRLMAEPSAGAEKRYYVIFMPTLFSYEVPEMDE